MFNKSQMTKFFFIFSFFFITPLSFLSGKENIKIHHKENSKNILRAHEKNFDIPEYLLMAIAYVESKWHPWAVNAKGESFYFSSKHEAIEFVRSLQEEGVRNIGVGYMQINLTIHGKNFKSLDEAFDPQKNIAYGARLIKKLYKRFDSWEKSIKYYHTATAKYNIPYHNRVYRTWQRIKQSTGSI